MKRKYFLIFLSVLALSIHSEAETMRYQSLNRHHGVRSAAMGAAVAGYVEGAESLFYNPAGLSVPGAEIQYQDYDFSGDTYPNASSVRAYFSPFGVGVLNVKDQNGDFIEVNTIGYGHRTQMINWGMTYKFIREESGGTQTLGNSADIGFSALITPHIRGGFVLTDALKNNIDVPTTHRAGLAFFNPSNSIVVSTDLVYENPNGTPFYQVQYGLDWVLSESLQAKLGYFRDTMTTGVSLKMPAFSIDYTVLIPQDENEESRSMFGVTLGGASSQKSNMRAYALFKKEAYAFFRFDSSVVTGKSEVSLLGGQRIGMTDLLSLVHEARQDPSCKGFIIRLGNLSSSLGSMSMIQELRGELKKAKQDNKEIIVYIEQWATMPEYYFATVADKIVMPELGTLSHLGLTLSVERSAKFFGMFGFEDKILASGMHKDALQPSAKPLTESQRVELQDMLFQLQQIYIGEIREDREIAWDEVSEAFDGRMISAKQAKAWGLIDVLGYYESAEALIASEGTLSDEAEVEPLFAFVSPKDSVPLLPLFNKIAVIEVDGPIHLGKNTSDILFGGKSTGADEIDELVEFLKKDLFLRGVILRINSPGGSLLASDRIYHSIKKLKEKGIPVYASMGNMAASGGYYIALAADKIFANSATLTGSIGVISTYRNRAGFNEMFGFDVDVLKTGTYADLFSPHRSMTEDEEALIKAHQSESYEVFVDKVKENRTISDTEIKTIAQGQTMTGKQAKELLLIDEVGNFFDTVDALSQKLGIEESPQLVYYRSRPTYTLPRLDFGFLMRLFSGQMMEGASRSEYQ